MIEARQLTKTFGRKVAVDDISFSVEKGEVLGFLGPNAAGKSTTMRMITGFLPPTWGTALVGGEDIVTRSLAARRKIGYLPENAPAYPDMTVEGFLDFIAEVRGYGGQTKRQRVGRVMERCFLKGVRHQSIGTLSKGFKQRVCFAQSILHDPEYLIMDEPTDGLDPNQKHEVRSMVREMAKDKAIILSTHILEEVEAVCTRVIIIAEGRIVADETPEGLRCRSTAHGALCFKLEVPPDPELLAKVGAIAGVNRVEIFRPEHGADEVVRVYPADAALPPIEELMRCFMEIRIGVRSFQVEKGRLDEVFRMITLNRAGDAES